MSATRVTIFGGSGFLGTGLRDRLLRRGCDVTIVARGDAAANRGWRHVRWDGRTLGDWASVLDETDVIVHLAGKRVDCRPTASNIHELISSREDTVRLVGEAIRATGARPTAWVQVSSLAVFGDAGEVVIDESTPLPTHGPRQQVEVCRRWEAAFHEASVDIERTVLLRPAIAIGGRDDPATKQLARLARYGLAGPVGGGRQWVSWIGADDLIGLLERAVTDATMTGLYHLAAPEPVRNRELMAAYRRAVGRRFGLPTPAPIARLGAWLLGSDPALALTGRRCVPTRLLEEGHEFRQTDLGDAVEAAVAAED